MMKQNTSFYITTAISYPNGAPHMGHAYESILADTLARFQRMDGCDVFFLTGVDEHGIKMVQTAARENLTPLQLANRNAPLFQALCDRLDISCSRFIRTSEPAHHEAAQALWKALMDSGFIYKDTYAGWYSVRDEAFYGEDETTLGPDGMRTGPLGTPVEWLEENTYFFRLSAFQDRLLDYYSQNDVFIFPQSSRKEVLSFVRAGLKDLSISRTLFTWGVPVPGDPAHVMYVWIDALANYLTGIGYPNTQGKMWHFWPANVHIIGKDITRFHCVYWAAMLMAAGLPLPKHIAAHGLIFYRGEKMSKSLGNTIDPNTLITHYGSDALRYFLLRDISFGEDGNYSHEGIITRLNKDLANDFGNLAQRTLTMIGKNCQGQIPHPGVQTPEDEALLTNIKALLPRIRHILLKTYSFHTALGEIWALITEVNRYFASQEPWKLTKTDPTRRDTVLYVTAEALRLFGLLLSPFIPKATCRLLDLLSVPPENRSFLALIESQFSLSPGTHLPSPEPLFPRYDVHQTQDLL
jgi:methionyl-tRNA synthetase